eukprot:scaffold1522_cov166-Amphora_coffeaeformis.AAC.19
MTKQSSSLLILLFVAFRCCCVSAFAGASKIIPYLSKPSHRPALDLLPPEVVSADWLSDGVAQTSTWISEATSVVAETADDDTGLLSNQAIIATFVIGVVPFAVATVEFWRRIAVGDSFGTGSDSVVIIGEDDAPLSSRGRRVLGKGALVTAYILFGIAAAVLGIVFYAVITSGSLEM